MHQFSLCLIALAVATSATAAPLSPNNVVSGTMGEIHIEGTLLSSTCSLRMETPMQNVDLGAVSALGLNKAGARSAVKQSFKLHFSGCLNGAYAQTPAYQRLQSLEAQAYGGNVDQFANGQYGVVVAFVGEPHGHNQDLLSVTGDTKGVGIRLSDAQGRDLSVNQPNRVYTLMPGENTLVFFAGLEATQAAIRAGNFSGIVNVRLTYL